MKTDGTASHLTSAVLDASAFVTNDRRLRPIPGLDLVVLADLRAAS